MPYEGTHERIDHLDSVLNAFIQHTEEGNAELRRTVVALERSIGTIERSIGTMEQSVGAMERSIGTMERSIATQERSLDSFKERVDQDIAEMREWRFQSQKQWGEIAQKLGKFVEDIVAPNIPRIAREIFGISEEEGNLFSAPRVRMQHPRDSSRMREFDYIYATRSGWVVVESKTDPKLKDIDEFRELLAEIREYFPQYAAAPLYPLFASLYVPDHVVKFCTRHGIYALGLGAQTMEVLNRSELSGAAHTEPPPSRS